MRRFLVALLAIGWGSTLVARDAVSQQRPQPEVLRTPDGTILDFHPDGVWRRKARQVATYRKSLLGQSQWEILNRPLMGGAPLQLAQAAVSGAMDVPTILFRYADRGTGASRSAGELDALLYGDVPPGGRPYTIHTLYDEMSNGLLDLRGEVLGWVTLDSLEIAYTGRPPCEQNPTGNDMCNGIWSGTAFQALNRGLREAITKVDASVDFGRFDNDGPDGIPNSGDDDGIVDLVLFIHSEQGGECTGDLNNHVWAHKSSGLSGFESDDPRAAGGVIRFRDYTIQSGVGGSTGCDPFEPMGIGTTSHELGHGLGLPDLYDTQRSTQGIGEWGLMGSGNWTTQLSPARFSPWSLNELGWVTVRELTDYGAYDIGAVPSADTTLLVRVRGDNPNGEYFLLENRQPLQSDSAMLRVHCERSEVPFPSGCFGGLLIWHVDSAIVASRRLFNGVNSGIVHGVGVVQADGLNSLSRAPTNRGDGGDVWPGVTNTSRFSFDSDPPAIDNVFRTFVGFQLDSIATTTAGGPVRLVFTPGFPTWVTGSSPEATVVVNGQSFAPYADVLPDGRVLTISAPPEQSTEDGRARFVFQSWSDGGAREHQIVASSLGDSVVANVAASYLLRLAALGDGNVATEPVVDPAGTFLDALTPLAITAEPSVGHVFDGWSGDTVSANPTLAITVRRPYDLTAAFAPVLTVTSSALPEALIGVAYEQAIGAEGGTGTTTWRLVSGSLPPGIALRTTGLVTGTPTDTGSYAAVVEARSGNQEVNQPVTLRVGTPAITAERVVEGLLAPTSILAAEEVAFLDFLGNRNGRFDIGDFLAWLELDGENISMDVMRTWLERGALPAREPQP